MAPIPRGIPRAAVAFSLLAPASSLAAAATKQPATTSKKLPIPTWLEDQNLVFTSATAAAAFSDKVMRWGTAYETDTNTAISSGIKYGNSIKGSSQKGRRPMRVVLCKDPPFDGYLNDLLAEITYHLDIDYVDVSEDWVYDPELGYGPGSNYGPALRAAQFGGKDKGGTDKQLKHPPDLVWCAHWVMPHRINVGVRWVLPNMSKGLALLARKELCSVTTSDVFGLFFDT
jgi:hypothetical protein